jgi:hypothetical protein
MVLTYESRVYNLEIRDQGLSYEIRVLGLNFIFIDLTLELGF